MREWRDWVSIYSLLSNILGNSGKSAGGYGERATMWRASYKATFGSQDSAHGPGVHPDRKVPFSISAASNMGSYSPVDALATAWDSLPCLLGDSI